MTNSNQQAPGYHYVPMPGVVPPPNQEDKKGKKKAKTKSQKGTQQDPKKVDTFMGWVIVGGAAMFILPVLSRNIEPYLSTLREMASGLIGLLFRVPMVGWSIAALVFAAVQAAEVWPLLTEESPAEQSSPKWRRKMLFLWTIATIAYAIDAIQCSRYWPILPEGVSIGKFIMTFSLNQLDWGNLIQTSITLFGLALFILLYRAIRRIA